MYWRDRALEHGEPKKRAMAQLVSAGREPGLLAYEEGSPVGWISVAPREDFAALLRSPQYRPDDDVANIWSIVCFTVDRSAQRQGLAGALLDAAVAHACARGAALVEAYPHVSNPTDYMGNLDLFLGRGFRPHREKAKRTIVRLELVT
jgi:GNAT superfamily N-acetyltransferase